MYFKLMYQETRELRERKIRERGKKKKSHRRRLVNLDVN